MSKTVRRERLLAAIVELVAREGYAAVTLTSVAEAAGVSRRSFYECFADKESCFLAALDEAREQLVAPIRRAVSGDPERAARVAVEKLVAFARSSPAAARVSLGEAMAAGPVALDARDRLVDEVGGLVEAAYESLDPSSRAPDVSPVVLVGGVCRLLAAQLRRSNRVTPALGDELTGWLGGYEQPLSAHRWRRLRPVELPPVAGDAIVHLVSPDPAERAAGEDIVAWHRARILAAVAHLSERQGYAATTVGEIAAEAGLSSGSFYRSFADKQEAFAALHEQQFRAIMSVSAGAFFAQEGWPERIWSAGRAFASYLEQNPVLARTSFIESYSGGPDRLRRVEELVGAFTLFLQEGYGQRALEDPPHPSVLDAIATTVFELSYRHVRAGRVGEIGSLVPHSAFISLAPFLGPEDTNAFLGERIASELGRASGQG